MITSNENPIQTNKWKEKEERNGVGEGQKWKEKEEQRIGEGREATNAKPTGGQGRAPIFDKQCDFDRRHRTVVVT